jgi:hypothetical protein
VDPPTTPIAAHDLPARAPAPPAKSQAPMPPEFGHFTDPGAASRAPSAPSIKPGPAPATGGSMSTISKPDANPVVAALLTWLLLGTGHLFINGQQRKWLFTLIAAIVGSILCLLPGVVISILSIIDAYQTAERLKNGEAIPENEYSQPMLFKVISMIDKTATCSKA